MISLQQIIHQELTIGKLINLQSFAHSQIFLNLTYPWEVLNRIGDYTSSFVNLVPMENRNKGSTIGSVFIDDNVIIGQGTVIQHGAMIKGPAIIGKNCQIRKGGYIRGNVILGDNCLIGNSPQLKNALIFNNAQIAHFNYIGDSVVGQYSHFAAGAITSNLKLAKNLIFIHYKDKISISTGLLKFGAIVGDKSEIGCNTVLNPGTIVGRECVIYPNGNIRGVIKQKHIVKIIQQQVLVQKLL